MTQQPVLVSVSRIIEALRTEGSLSPADLLKKVDTPKKTFYRALNALKETGVVVTKDGKHYWHEFLDIRAYKNEFEAELALKHSINLTSGLKQLLGSGQTFLEGEVLPDPEYVEPALMHLKTGYSSTFEIYQKAENVREQTNEKEDELEKEVEVRLSATSLQPQYPEHIVKIILSDMKDVLRGRKPYFLNDIRIQGEDVKSGSYTSLAKREKFDLLRHFMMQEETLESNKKICTKVVEMEGEYYRLRQEFESQIKSLIMQVENGTTLKGKCHMCPKIRISS